MDILEIVSVGAGTPTLTRVWSRSGPTGSTVGETDRPRPELAICVTYNDEASMHRYETAATGPIGRCRSEGAPRTGGFDPVRWLNEAIVPRYLAGANLCMNITLHDCFVDPAMRISARLHVEDGVPGPCHCSVGPDVFLGGRMNDVVGLLAGKVRLHEVIERIDLQGDPMMVAAMVGVFRVIGGITIRADAVEGALLASRLVEVHRTRLRA